MISDLAGVTTATFADNAGQQQFIYTQQRGNTYENVDILRVHPHQVSTVAWLERNFLA